MRNYLADYDLLAVSANAKETALNTEQTLDTSLLVAKGNIIQLEPRRKDNVVLRELTDYLIEDFEGIGYAPDRPLEKTRENKYKIAFLSPLRGEKSLWDFIIEKANELRTFDEEETEAELKNS